MSAVKAVIVELLDNLNVPFVSVSPPAVMPITEVASRTLELLDPLLTVRSLKVVVLLPEIVAEAAPVKFIVLVEAVKVPLLAKLPPRL